MSRRTESGHVTVPVSYRRQWQDGFGARGWKLDVSLHEPSVIAATAAHGERIPTSVLVHDILDHHLSGFAIGGHRNEAKALVQLAARTGSDPTQDYAQIIDEDLLNGHCNGESLRAFLPADLLAYLGNPVLDDRAAIQVLVEQLGREALRARLVEHFFAIGEAAQPGVERHWFQLGLDYQNRAALGLALQALLAAADAAACEADWPQAHGRFLLRDRDCTLEIDTPEVLNWTQGV